MIITWIIANWFNFDSKIPNFLTLLLSFLFAFFYLGNILLHRVNHQRVVLSRSHLFFRWFFAFASVELLKCHINNFWLFKICFWLVCLTNFFIGFSLDLLFPRNSWCIIKTATSYFIMDIRPIMSRYILLILHINNLLFIIRLDRIRKRIWIVAYDVMNENCTILFILLRHLAIFHCYITKLYNINFIMSTNAILLNKLRLILGMHAIIENCLDL